MARVAEAEVACCEVEHRHEQRDEAAVRALPAERAVDARDRVVRRSAFVTNARTVACRLETSSAAGSPLPQTSAMQTARRPGPSGSAS